MHKVILELGKVDYNGVGRRNHPVTIVLTLTSSRLSIVGNIWQANRRDVVSGGQNLDEILGLFADDERVARIVEIWRRWHLNDMRAGSPAQEAWLREHSVHALYPASYLDMARKALVAAGLQPDPNYERGGKPYSYGSAWLTEELPAEIVTELLELFVERAAA